MLIINESYFLTSNFLNLPSFFGYLYPELDIVGCYLTTYLYEKKEIRHF